MNRYANIYSLPSCIFDWKNHPKDIIRSESLCDAIERKVVTHTNLCMGDDVHASRPSKKSSTRDRITNRGKLGQSDIFS